jgi:hypothetical protein
LFRRQADARVDRFVPSDHLARFDGHAAEGIAVVERAIAPLRAAGIEVRVTALDTLIG